MQKIEVVINSDCFNAVYEALRKAKLGPCQVTSLRIFGPATPDGLYRGATYPVGRDCMMLAWTVRDHGVKTTLEAIREGLGEFAQEAAEVVVYAVEESMRLRSSVWARAREPR